MDEPCHLATAVVVLGAITRWRGSPPAPFVLAMLAASVLIDLDHLGLESGFVLGGAGMARPGTHALWPAAVLAAVAGAAARRRPRAAGRPAAALVAAVTAGAACGLCAHLLRDVATAPVSLWWPVSAAGAEIPYGWYLAAMLALTALPLPLPPRFRRALRPGR